MLNFPGGPGVGTPSSTIEGAGLIPGQGTRAGGFPGGSDGKQSACNVGDSGLIAGLGRSPGEGNGNPLQYSCLENPWTEEPGELQSMGSQRAGHD